MAPYIYMIVIVNDFVCYDNGLWRMIAIPGNADKRMSGSVCEARDRQAQKQNKCANPEHGSSKTRQYRSRMPRQTVKATV